MKILSTNKTLIILVLIGCCVLCCKNPKKPLYSGPPPGGGVGKWQIQIGAHDFFLEEEQDHTKDDYFGPHPEGPWIREQPSMVFYRMDKEQ